MCLILLGLLLLLMFCNCNELEEHASKFVIKIQSKNGGAFNNYVGLTAFMVTYTITTLECEL